MYALYNGQFIPLSQATLSVTDKGYFFDFAVYDSLKVVQGQIFFPEFHVDRLLDSADRLELHHQFKKADILKWLDQLVQKNNLTDALLRTVLIGDPDDNQTAKLYIFPVSGLTFYNHSLYHKGVKVITYRGERRIPQSKSKDLLLGFLALREAEKQGAIDALLVDHGGNIREGTRSNFFAIKDGTLWSPPADKILAGITRQIVLQIAQNKFKYKESDIPLARIKDFDELFITSTSKNIMPIRQIDEIILRDNFPQTKILQKLFKEYYL